MANGRAGAKERDVADTRVARGAASSRLEDTFAIGRHRAAKFGFRVGAGPGRREGQISADGGDWIRKAQHLVVRHRGGPERSQDDASERRRGPRQRSASRNARTQREASSFY